MAGIEAMPFFYPVNQRQKEAAMIKWKICKTY